MVAASGRAPLTLLEQLIWGQNRTYEELARGFADVARTMGERATITPRHFARLARGERGAVNAAPSTRRVLERMYDRPADELLRRLVDATDPVAASQTRRPGTNIIMTSTTEALEMAVRRARKFAIVAGQAGTTAEVIDQFHDDIRRLALAYPQQPLVAILGDLLEVQDGLFTLLEMRQRPEHAQQLYFLAGVATGMLAKASHDQADPHTAMTLARTAFLCADNAGHDGLRAWLRGLQSMIAYWAQRTQEAVRFAQSGGEFAARGNGTTAVWLPMNEARAWAALGNGEAAADAIVRAEAAWDSSQPDTLDELGGICTFFQPRQLYYAADALAWLPDRAAEAERYSLLAVDAYADSSRPEWAFGDQAGSQCDLAIARIARRDLEGAADAVRPVLSLPADQRINGIISSVERVHRAIGGTAVHPIASDLRDEIESFTQFPASGLTGRGR